MLSEITVAGTGDRSNPAIKRSLSPGRNISRSSEPADLRSDSEYSGYRTAILLSADSASITNDPLSVFGWYPGIHSHLSVPIDLEPYGATERRTLQSLPAKNGTADLVIGSGNAHSNEEGGTSADTSERGSIAAGQTIRERRERRRHILMSRLQGPSPEQQPRSDSQIPQRHGRFSRLISVHQRPLKATKEWSESAIQRASHVDRVGCSDTSRSEDAKEEASRGHKKRDDKSVPPSYDSLPLARMASETCAHSDVRRFDNVVCCLSCGEALRQWQIPLVYGTKSGKASTNEFDLSTKKPKEPKSNTKEREISYTERIAAIQNSKKAREDQVLASQDRLLEERETPVSTREPARISEIESEERTGNGPKKPRQEKTNATEKWRQPLNTKNDDAPLTPLKEETVEEHQSYRAEIQRPSIAARSPMTEADACLVREEGAIARPQMPKSPLVMLPKTRTSDMPQDSVRISSDHPTSLGSSVESGSGTNGEGKGRSSIESASESGETSEQCEAHVESALSSAMIVVKNLLLRELLDHTLPDATDAVNGSSATISEGTGSSATSSLASSSGANPHTPRRSKRSRGNEPDPNDDDGDNSDDEDRPKKKGNRRLADRRQRRLKCPFYQRQPEKYTKASCTGEGFVDMAKLKDHIKRVHTQKLRCPRCWLEMDSEEACDEHLRQKIICQRGPEPKEDGIRPQLLRRLDFKKAPYSNARNVEEKWKMLFSALFSSDSTIPSPCESTLCTLQLVIILTRIDKQQGMSRQLELALCEALEEELTRELALVIEPIMTKIKGCIPAIIESCRQKLNSTTSGLYSDNEAVFTPSATSSGIGSSKSGCGSSAKAARQWVDSTPSRHEAPPVIEALAIESQNEILKPPIPYAGVVNTTNLHYNLTTEHGFDYGMIAFDAHHPYQGSRDNSIKNPGDHVFNPVRRPGPDACSETLLGGSNFTAGSKSAAFQDAQEPRLEPCEFGRCSPPQNHVSLSEFPNLAGSLADDKWDDVNTRQEDVSAEWPDNGSFSHLFTPEQWDHFMDDPNV
jgi:hypothetical protein